MAYQGVMDDVRACVALEEPSQVPIFACSEEFDVRVAGEVYDRYNSDADVMAAVQTEVIERFDYDWAWLQVDDCIEFEVLGVGVKGKGNILPATCDYLPVSRETLGGLHLPDPATDGRMPVLLKAIHQLKERFGDSICVCGRTAAPFSSATLFYGMTQTFMALRDDAQLIQETLDFFVELQSMWGQAQIEAGADALWFGDCNASGHLVSVADYEAFAADGVRRCAAAYHAAGGVVIYHASEHKVPHMRAQAATGIDVLSIGPGADIALVKEELGGEICLIGNLDPIGVLFEGTREDVRRETERVMQIGKQGGGYIFNSGEMIPRMTPEEHIVAMMETARSLASY
jgi:MtaA/CmuA family methyltransferase